MEPDDVDGASDKDGERYGEQIFAHTRDKERDRLDAISRTYDPVTHQRIGALGLRPGMRFLDAGAGTGELALWLTAHAAPREVVVLDRSTVYLDPLRAPNLRVVAADLTAEDLSGTLEPASFDLVHARFLLMHLPERDRVLQRLVSWLAPGGVLLLGDSVDLTTQSSREPAVRAAFAALWSALRSTIGTDITWVRDYPARLTSLGLIDQGLDVFLPAIVPGAPISRFWQLTFEQTRTEMIATGLVSDSELHRASTLFETPGFAELSPGMISAWARRPDANSLH
ncbi:class I SAM-dependent methyltransferase [Actinomadura sp. KC216]|uniref:class I SAM-dependent methyltransferase n=1 Tax=Actinomadura sp. KC216 TaxID=2530370 RepID=UPI0010481F13|nr:class I SAM-dependent methyltransferase [Actinomadura sp. KC216]TDB90559.1 class I SAM-dependent methyltransferase [Actinomadura sp. KC216]